MTARRPGAPRRAGRPVVPSPGRSGARSGGTGAQQSRAAASRPAGAARRRTSRPPVAAAQPEQEGPVWGITRRGLVLIALIVVALATLVPTLNSYVSQRQQLTAAQDEVAERRAEVDELQHRVDQWEDPNFVAAQARERLLYAMPGETQYRLTDTSGKDVPLTEDQRTAAAAAKKDWYDALWTSVEASSRLTAQDVPEEGQTAEQTGTDGTERIQDGPGTSPTDQEEDPTP